MQKAMELLLEKAGKQDNQISKLEALL